MPGAAASIFHLYLFAHDFAYLSGPSQKALALAVVVALAELALVTGVCNNALTIGIALTSEALVTWVGDGGVWEAVAVLIALARIALGADVNTVCNTTIYPSGDRVGCYHII